MKWYEILGIIASLFSIISAIYVSSYSKIINKTRNEIFSTLKIVKFSNINEINLIILDQIKKVSHKQNIPRGTNIPEIINALNSYYEKLFKLKVENEVNTNSNLNNLINHYRKNIDTLSSKNKNEQQDIIEIFNELYQLTLSIDYEFNSLTKKIVEKVT